MTEDSGRHPFLDDLTADAQLSSSVLRDVVTGRDNIRLAVDAVGTLYRRQTPLSFIETDARSVLEYEAQLEGGAILRATVVIDRDADGGVPAVSVRMGPLGAVLAVSAALRDILQGKLPDHLFL